MTNLIYKVRVGGFRGKSEARIRRSGKDNSSNEGAATHTPFGCVGSHKNMEQQAQGWCESDATNRWFRLYEKKEFAFFDVPEPEHRTKMGGMNHVVVPKS